MKESKGIVIINSESRIYKLDTPGRYLITIDEKTGTVVIQNIDKEPEVRK